jgi:hypothetical protein
VSQRRAKGRGHLAEPLWPQRLAGFAIAPVGQLASSELELDPRDLFALIELRKRTDRVLPNGLSMLPPRQTCDRGNACLTCDKFTTDASYLPEHEAQLRKLSELIAQRQEAFRARTGEDMTPSNVWLEQRLTEQRALQKIVAVLSWPPH